MRCSLAMLPIITVFAIMLVFACSEPLQCDDVVNSVANFNWSKHVVVLLDAW